MQAGIDENLRVKEEQAQGCATGKAQLQAQAGARTACPAPCNGICLRIMLHLQIHFSKAAVHGQCQGFDTDALALSGDFSTIYCSFSEFVPISTGSAPSLTII